MAKLFDQATKAAKYTFSRLTDAQIEKYQAQLGRVLSPAEKLMGSLIRKPSPQFGSAVFKVRLTNEPSTDPFDREYEDAKKRARDEELGKMTPAARALALVTEAREARKAKELAGKDHEAKLQAFQPTLQQIDALLEEARFDESYTYEDVQRLWDTKLQIETEGACVVAAQELVASCLKTHQEKTQGRRATTVAELDKMKAEQARLQAQLDALDVSLGNKPSSKAEQAKLEKQRDQEAYSAYVNSHPAIQGYLGITQAEFNALPFAEKRARQSAYQAYQAEQEKFATTEPAATE